MPQWEPCYHCFQLNRHPYATPHPTEKCKKLQAAHRQTLAASSHHPPPKIVVVQNLGGMPPKVHFVAAPAPVPAPPRQQHIVVATAGSSRPVVVATAGSSRAVALAVGRQPKQPFQVMFAQNHSRPSSMQTANQTTRFNIGSGSQGPEMRNDTAMNYCPHCKERKLHVYKGFGYLCNTCH